MKKIFLVLVVIILGIFILPKPILAAKDDPKDLFIPGAGQSAIKDVIGTIAPPSQVVNIGFGNVGIATLLNNTISIIFVLSGIAAVFMVLISAVQFIFSGGDKEAVAGARKRLTYAIIGLVILALAFWIVNVVGHIAGFKGFGDFQNPIRGTGGDGGCGTVNGKPRSC